jgi:hypothetical protein
VIYIPFKIVFAVKKEKRWWIAKNRDVEMCCLYLEVRVLSLKGLALPASPA